MIQRQTLFSTASAATLAFCLTPFAARAQSTDFVYVETNTTATNSNAVLGYTRGASGQLTPIAGSPFAAGGTGYSGVPNLTAHDSDQDIITNADRSLLFAVNSGSDTIAVFRIAANGALAPVPGSPFPSGGNQPVSLEIVGNILFVTNKADDPARPTNDLPNYSTLRIQADGSLIPVNRGGNTSAALFPSTVSVAGFSAPSQIHAIPNSNLLIGLGEQSGLITPFFTDFNGGLFQLPSLAAPASEYPVVVPQAQGRPPVGIWQHPSAPILYVGYSLANRLAVYSYNRAGTITFLRTVANGGEALCWVRPNRAGTRLYTSDTGTNSIGVYDISVPDQPVEIQEFHLRDPGISLQIDLSTDNRSLYALSIPYGPISGPAQSELHSLTVAADGTLSETLAPIVYALPGTDIAQGATVVASR